MKVTVETHLRLDASKRVGPGFTRAEYKAIDWNDSSDRKWLMNHLHWAMNNGRQIRLVGPEIESN